MAPTPFTERDERRTSMDFDAKAKEVVEAYWADELGSDEIMANLIAQALREAYLRGIRFGASDPC